MKILRNNIIAAAIFCAMVAVNSFFLSSVLATTPKDGGIKSINVEELAPLSTFVTEAEEKSPPESETVLNSISEKEALKLAIHTLDTMFGSDRDLYTKEKNSDSYFSLLPNKTRLVASAPPLNTAIWSIAFYEENPDGIILIFRTVINAQTGEVGVMGRIADIKERVFEWENKAGVNLEESLFYQDSMIFRTEDGKFIYGVFDNEGLLVSFWESSDYVKQRYSDEELQWSNPIYEPIYETSHIETQNENE
jgi:hypothetical protein